MSQFIGRFATFAKMVQNDDVPNGCVQRQHAKNAWKDNLPQEGYKDNFKSH